MLGGKKGESADAPFPEVRRKKKNKPTGAKGREGNQKKKKKGHGVIYRLSSLFLRAPKRRRKGKDLRKGKEVQEEKNFLRKSRRK